MRLCVLYIVSVLFFASCKHKDNNSYTVFEESQSLTSETIKIDSLYLTYVIHSE